MSDDGRVDNRATESPIIGQCQTRKLYKRRYWSFGEIMFIVSLIWEHLNNYYVRWHIDFLFCYSIILLCFFEGINDDDDCVR